MDHRKRQIWRTSKRNEGRDMIYCGECKWLIGVPHPRMGCVNEHLIKYHPLFENVDFVDPMLKNIHNDCKYFEYRGKK